MAQLVLNLVKLILSQRSVSSSSTEKPSAKAPFHREMEAPFYFYLMRKEDQSSGLKVVGS
jgi:hypothetical protein